MKGKNWEWAVTPLWIFRWVLLGAFFIGLALTIFGFANSDRLEVLGIKGLIIMVTSGIVFLGLTPRKRKK